ncbi:hypothetical protein CK203_114347 [Vitis vinifera]|uniref:Uncharacterized protein n=1 Tax=Vitis vinifera TaxID=29760 RepID=A0A438CDN7_VITVI|nr:hypothetical protein CK203_114347 [Vitis vinifera]
MRARLGPQEPRRSRPPMGTTWAPRLTPWPPPGCKTFTRIVTRSHPRHAERSFAPSGTTAGRNLPNEPPIGSISKRLDDMLSTPFCSHIIHYEPPWGFLVQNFHIRWNQRSFDHIMHYRQLMTLDIGNDALLCKSIFRQPTRAGPFMVSSPTSQLC